MCASLVGIKWVICFANIVRYFLMAKFFMRILYSLDGLRACALFSFGFPASHHTAGDKLAEQNSCNTA